MNKLLLIILLFPFWLFSQTNIDCVVERELTGCDTYIGWLDVEGRFKGKGKYIFSNGDYYEGDFFNGNFEGKGKMTKSNGSYYEGEWKQDKRNGKGISLIVFENQEQIRDGEFKNNILFNGIQKINFQDGTYTEKEYKYGDQINSIQKFQDNIIKSYGTYFSNGTLKTGTRRDISQKGNLIVESRYENGDKVIGSEKSNIKNYYVKDDIEGNLDYTIIDLEFEINDNTKYVNLSFLNSKRSQTEKFRFVFDTGAEVFSIGFNLFNKLKEEGLLYDDLGVIMETVGVKGESMQNKVIRIKEINIGQYKLKNVIAFVKTLETANSSLLGIGFLNKFSEVQWSLISNQLILYK